MSDVIKNALYRQRRTFNKSFSKVKTWHCKSMLKDYANRKWIKSLLEKNDKFGWTLVVDVAGLNHAVIIQFSGVARSRYPTCVNGSVTHWKHWFWVKLALTTFIATSTTAVDNSAICTTVTNFCFVCEIFVPFWCFCGTARRAFHFAR